MKSKRLSKEKEFAKRLKWEIKETINSKKSCALIGIEGKIYGKPMNLKPNEIKSDLCSAAWYIGYHADTLPSEENNYDVLSIQYAQKLRKKYGPLFQKAFELKKKEESLEKLKNPSSKIDRQLKKIRKSQRKIANKISSQRVRDGIDDDKFGDKVSKLEQKWFDERYNKPM